MKKERTIRSFQKILGFPFEILSLKSGKKVHSCEFSGKKTVKWRKKQLTIESFEKREVRIHEKKKFKFYGKKIAEFREFSENL